MMNFSPLIATPSTQTKYCNSQLSGGILPTGVTSVESHLLEELRMVKEGTGEGTKRREHCLPRESLALLKESKSDSILFDVGKEAHLCARSARRQFARSDFWVMKTQMDMQGFVEAAVYVLPSKIIRG